jgi:hypothetical protein
MLCIGVSAKFASISLVQEDDSSSLSCQSRVQQLSAQDATGVWDHQQRLLELAALCFVDCDCVGQLER